MGERGLCGACPSPAGFMHILGIAISYFALLLEGLLVLRGAGNRVFRVFPLLYSYIIFCFCNVIGLYLAYWLASGVYPSIYWISFLVSILIEFTVLVEISDQIFQPFPAIRNLGRAITIGISMTLGLVYILPAILGATHRRPALLTFALRISVTKAVILIVLFYVARHYCSQLGRNVAGIMYGFSIYLAINIVTMAAGKVFDPPISTNLLWVMSPLASALCMLMWTVSLWELEPLPKMGTVSPVAGRDSEAVALELARFNGELTKLLHK